MIPTDITIPYDGNNLVRDLYDAQVEEFREGGNEPQELVLNEMERTSALWLKIDQILAKMLQELRESNDIPLGEVATALIRGNIERVKIIRELGQAPTHGDDQEDPSLGY